MEQVYHILIFSLITGSMYALVAIGYSLIYSVLGILNFAHGDLLAVGAYACWFICGAIGFPLYIAIPISVLLTGILSLLFGKMLLIPANRRSGFAALIVAIGISLGLQNLIALLCSPEARPFNYMRQQQPWTWLPCKPVHVLIFFICISSLIGIWLFLKKTRTGIEIRACASNGRAAYILGMRREYVFSVIFLLSGLFAGIAGVLKGLDDQLISPNMGFALGINAFIASVLGGIKNFRGAVAGAFLLGGIENICMSLFGSTSFLNVLSSVVSKDVVAITLLVCVLLWRPTGLFAVPYERRP